MKLVYCLEYCKSDLNFQKSKRYAHLEIHAHSQIIINKPPQQEHWKIKTSIFLNVELYFMIR